MPIFKVLLGMIRLKVTLLQRWITHKGRMKMELLNLSGYKILDEIFLNDHDCRIIVQLECPPELEISCPDCGSTNIYRHGVRNQLFLDVPMRGKRVGIGVIRQRHRCRDCKRTFHDCLPGMSEAHSATNDLVTYIKREALKRPFTALAEEVGLNEGTIRRISDEYICHLEKTTQIETPEWLGIDEICLSKRKFYTVISNLKGKRKMVEMLPDRDKLTVKQYFQSFPDREKIRVVCMDMNWSDFREAVEECLPNARIVVDKFHFVHMANEALEAVIKKIRRKLTSEQRVLLSNVRSFLMKRRGKLKQEDIKVLEAFLKDTPILEEAYKLKEDFCDIYQLKNRFQALERSKSLQVSVPAEIKPAFAPLIKAINSWDEEIFNYFDERVTNAYAEGLNSLIRLVNYTGRGYSFKVIRARTLYSVGQHEPQKPPYDKTWIPPKKF